MKFPVVLLLLSLIQYQQWYCWCLVIVLQQQISSSFRIFEIVFYGLCYIVSLIGSLLLARENHFQLLLGEPKEYSIRKLRHMKFRRGTTLGHILFSSVLPRHLHVKFNSLRCPRQRIKPFALSRELSCRSEPAERKFPCYAPRKQKTVLRSPP